MNFKSLFKTVVITCLSLSFIISLSIGHSLYANTPTTLKQQGYITDYAQVLTIGQKQSLTRISTIIEQKTGAQLATLIIPEMGDNWTIEGYANQIFESWGIGQKGQDNGLLFLIALKEKKLRIEVGYGLEGHLPDGKAGEIRDQFILPHFKEGNIQKGIISGHFALASVIATAFNVQITQADIQPVSHQKRSQPTQSSPFQNMMLLLIIGLIIIGMIKSPTFRAFMFGMLIASAFSRGGYRRSSMGHFGGGGFGGFGGGLSGGGGASGGW
jgi:uncharacterized protein